MLLIGVTERVAASFVIIFVAITDAGNICFQAFIGFSEFVLLSDRLSLKWMICVQAGGSDWDLLFRQTRFFKPLLFSSRGLGLRQEGAPFMVRHQGKRAPTFTGAEDDKFAALLLYFRLS